MPLADAGTLAGNDLSEGRDIAAERIRIFVINSVCIDATEMTLSIIFFLHWGHNRGSREVDLRCPIFRMKRAVTFGDGL